MRSTIKNKAPTEEPTILPTLAPLELPPPLSLPSSSERDTVVTLSTVTSRPAAASALSRSELSADFTTDSNSDALPMESSVSALNDTTLLNDTDQVYDDRRRRRRRRLASVDVTTKSWMVDASTGSSVAMVDFNVDLSALVGAALAVTVSSTETFTVSSVVGEEVGTGDGWLFPGMVGEGVHTAEPELSVNMSVVVAPE